MFLKFIFDRLAALFGLLLLWPVILVTAILVKVKMPGGPAFFVQKRVGKDGKLFNSYQYIVADSLSGQAGRYFKENGIVPDTTAAEYEVKRYR